MSDVMARSRSNAMRRVLVGRSDRMARDQLASEVLLGEFHKRGVTVIAADAGTDLTASDHDPTRVLIRQVLGTVAQFEQSVIVAMLRAARVCKRKSTGRRESRKPFGTKRGAAETLALIRRLRRKPRGGEHLSYDSIAARLNDMGKPSRSGGRWLAPTVCEICNQSER